MNVSILESMASRYLEAIRKGEPREAAEHCALTYYSYVRPDADIPEAMVTLDRMHRHIEKIDRWRLAA